jgi:anaerobic ribonucleoside-triphosphate reductase
MDQLTHELLNELIELRALKQRITGNLTFETCSKGGKSVGNRVNTCPNCGREIKGNSGFGQHVKKCNKSLDK